MTAPASDDAPRPRVWIGLCLICLFGVVAGVLLAPEPLILPWLSKDERVLVGDWETRDPDTPLTVTFQKNRIAVLAVPSGASWKCRWKADENLLHLVSLEQSGSGGVEPTSSTESLPWIIGAVQQSQVDNWPVRSSFHWQENNLLLVESGKSARELLLHRTTDKTAVAVESIP